MFQSLIACWFAHVRGLRGIKCLHLMLNGNVLRQVPATKYLGTHNYRSTSYLEYSKCYIEYILNRVRGNLYCIIGLDMSLLRFCFCWIKHILCPFWIIVMLCGLPPVQCIYTQHLERVHSRFISSLSASNCPVFDLKLSLMERKTFHTTV